MSVRQAIVDWSDGRPPWQQDLLRRVAVREADDQACLEVLDLLLGHHGLAPAALAPKPLVIGDLPDDAPTSPSVLHEIGECRNLNAIDSREPLRFEPRHITLVYGPNGVGKSGYTRIIKRIAHSAYEEPILPNVFGSGSAPPRAVVELENENGRGKHIVPLADEGPALLDSTVVFDARCAAVYLRSEKTVGFTPTPLRIFGRAATAQVHIRELLDDRIATLRGRRPSLDSFATETQVRMELEALAGQSSFEEIRRLASLTEDELKELATARLELAAVDAGASESQAVRCDRDADDLDALARDLENASHALSPDVETNISNAREGLMAAESAVALARSTTLSGEIEATGGEGWLRMWEAVRHFVEQDCHHTFPPTSRGDECPFCRQELSEASRDRLHRLEEFVKGTLDREREGARRSLEEALAPLKTGTLETLGASQGMRLLKDSDPDLAAKAEAWVAVAVERRSALLATVTPPALPAHDTEAVGRLAAKRRAEGAHHRSLVKPQEREALRKRVAEGDARVHLGDRLIEFQTWHSTLQTIDALRDVRKELDTGRLSHKQTELAKEVVTDALGAAVREELQALGFSHLKVDLTCRTDRGETVARIRLENASASLGEVLSAGEQRACALAFFLAEARASGSRGGLVFDDPSIAFDAERLDHIARRIAQLADKREQVIVFSCDLVFAWCLQQACAEQGVGFAVRPMARLGNKVGVVRREQSWPGEPLSKRIGRLRDGLQSLGALERQGDIDAYEERAKKSEGPQNPRRLGNA